MQSQLYLFIIWKNSLHKKDIILEDIKKKFIIREVFEISWNEKEFENNLKRFYGSLLSNASEKAELCGKGSFLLIIISDPNARIEKRFLDDVNEVDVNLNVYDCKMKYRKWIGVDFALHASNSQKETSHDLMLLLGEKVEDLEKKLAKKWDKVIKKKVSELIGHKKWNNIKQLLDVLNETTNYVILRNFEELPDKLIHHDIDILTDDVKSISNIINESEDADGKAPITVGDKEILLDFRYQEGHHYDEKWAKDILKRRIMYQNKFYVPCDKDYFYTLLYHAIIQRKIREEYKKILCQLARRNNIHENIEGILEDFDKSKKILVDYMSKMGYHRTTIDRRILYKIRHGEIIRLINTSIFLTKKYGIRFLLTKIKIKINLMKNGK
jgi:hypothetical protein